MSFGADVTAGDSSAKGRSDMGLRMSKYIYVIEMKYDQPADEALAQIDERGHA